MIRFVLLAVVFGCGSGPVHLDLPRPDAAFEQRLSAYRWQSIGGTYHGRHRSYPVLNDGRVIHDVATLAEVGDGVTARAVRHRDALESRALRWFALGAAAGFATFGAVDVEVFEHPRLAAIGATFAVGLALAGLCIHRGAVLDTGAADARTIAITHYNDELRDALRLCTRDFQIVDCDR